MTELIHGKNINLRLAVASDKKNIYNWLAKSDLTKFMLGPPYFPDTSIPTWDDFVRDYHSYYFDDSEPLMGRCFIILLDGLEIGQINYNEIYKDETELDIWLSNNKYTGHGYGTEAIELLCSFLNKKMGVKKFYMAPSTFNTRAIKSYKKAGFIETKEIPNWFVPDYEETVLLKKVYN